MNNLNLIRYKTNAGQTIGSGAITVINYEDLVYDPYFLVTTGANWVFTANHAGYYMVQAMAIFTTTDAWALGEIGTLMLYKNGGQFSVLDFKDNYSADANLMALHGNDLVYMAVGDTLDIRIYQGTGGNLDLYNDGDYNYVSIWKI